VLRAAPRAYGFEKDRTLPRRPGGGLEPLTQPLIRRCFALSYFCTARGFAPRLNRKPSVCWVVLAALNCLAAATAATTTQASSTASELLCGRHWLTRQGDLAGSERSDHDRRRDRAIGGPNAGHFPSSNCRTESLSGAFLSLIRVRAQSPHNHSPGQQHRRRRELQAQHDRDKRAPPSPSAALS